MFFQTIKTKQRRIKKNISLTSNHSASNIPDEAK